MAKKKMNARERREAEAAKRSKQYSQNYSEKVVRSNSDSDNRNKQTSKMVRQVNSLEVASAKEAFSTDEFIARIKVLSPLHLGSGEENVIIDAEIVHDEFGLPYFPGKRFKGLLYESALEVSEMFELAGIELFNKSDVDKLFQRGDKSNTGVQLVIPNLYISEYQDIRREWKILQEAYPEYFQPYDVLEQYTTIRYQTRIDRETGVATDTSLHNMRVLNSGIIFSATIQLNNASKLQKQIIALAFRNLSQAGVKRNRGFGNIECLMEHNQKDIRSILVKSVLKEGGLLE